VFSTASEHNGTKNEVISENDKDIKGIKLLARETSRTRAEETINNIEHFKNNKTFQYVYKLDTDPLVSKYKVKGNTSTTKTHSRLICTEFESTRGHFNKTNGEEEECKEYWTLNKKRR